MEAAWNESATSSPSSNAYSYGDGSWPDPGWPLTNRPALLTGIFSVFCGQVVVILYHFFHLRSGYSRIQKAVMPESSFLSDMMGHLAQPEGFVLLSLYLSGTWMFRLMPKSYYSDEGFVNPVHVFAQLVINDFFQTVMHLGEHKLSPWIYRMSHKPHHRFLNPKMFDAFNGSLCDTIFMILLPLFLTAQIVHCNVWSYMAFGTIYASWLTLLHSEVSHPWDPLFRKIGFGTAGDHHVHHKCFIFNFGHLFMWWDMMFGTYKSPLSVETFNKNI